MTATGAAPQSRQRPRHRRRQPRVDEPLDQLATAAGPPGVMVAELSEVGDAVLGYFVDRARHAGASWTAISAALGVSKQAAHKRFAAATRPPGLGRFTDRARRVLSSATDVARGLGHAYVGTEHLLLALYTEPDGLAARVLVEAGIDRDAVEEAVLRRVPRRAETPEPPLPHTPCAVAVIEGTVREALLLGHNYVGTEHLLLVLYTVPVAPVGPAGSRAERAAGWPGSGDGAGRAWQPLSWLGTGDGSGCAGR